MEENIYKQARLAAAKKNPSFKSVEKAYPVLYISREKLLMIEQSAPNKKKVDPSPYEVVRMAEAYDAPELCDYYCTHQCPLGSEKVPLKYDLLSEITTSLMSSLYFLDRASDQIHQILADYKVDEEEKAEFLKSLAILKDLAYSVNCLELWAQKNGLLK